VNNTTAERGTKGRVLAARAAGTVLLGLLGLVGITPPAAASDDATYNVTSSANSGPGSYRAAINAANDDTAPVTISFATDLLVQITDDVTYTGDQALDLQGHGARIDGGGAHQILAAPLSPEVSVTDMVLRNGSSNAGGGAIETGGSVSITTSQLIGNTATDSGGAIAASGGGVKVDRSTLRGNTTEDDGGAIRTSGGFILLTESTVEDNESTGGAGGALRTSSGAVSTYSSTVSGNTAAGDGGGIRTGSAEVLLTHSTFADNSSGGAGGAVRSGGAPVEVVNSTFTENVAAVSGGVISDPGGQTELTHVTATRNDAPSGATIEGDTLDISASVVSDTLSASPGCALSGATTDSYSYETGTSCGFADAGTSVEGGLDPLFTSLTGNGGLTRTMRPLNPSPLVDAVPTGSCLLDDDQRGIPRPLPGSPSTDGCDIGAVESGYQAFTDVPDFHSFYLDIAWMAEQEISTGFQPGPDYRPSADVTRQAMSAFMYRLAGSPAFADPPFATFTDVATTSDFFTEIEWMAFEGITTGFPGNLYKPGAEVTRQAMSAFMYRLADGPGVDI
jgi:predicted outer membrane repeat protein